MSRFNTGNNIGSLSEEDFYDNCLSLDQAMNSTEPTWRDRFNVEKPTIDAALKSAGFMPAGFDFVTGGTLQPGDRNKAVYNPAPNGDNNWYRWNGVFPKEIAANSQPNPKDENNWVLAHFRIGIAEKEALRRTYLEAGYNLVEGSFETGGILVNINDVLLYEAEGKAYSWGGTLTKTVIAGSTPSSSGGIGAGAWTDRSTAPNAFKQSGAGAVPRTAQEKMRDTLDVRDYGATGSGADESAAAIAMISAHNYLYVPPGFVLTMKNVGVFDGTEIICDGTLRLPNACSDFDRLIHGDGKSRVSIKIKELDGNAVGQSGNIGTHLIYLTNCPGAVVDVKYAHDHYIASGATMPSVDGIRNTSSGGVFLYRCHKSELKVGLLEGWGREGIFLSQCDDSVAVIGHVQGKGVTEYSGVQVNGNRSKLLRASVDNAGASGVGFDVVDGIIENIISTNTREMHGVNFGHPGFPASGTRGSNIVVDGCFVDGIKVQSATIDISIDNFAVKNAGRYGISVSDSSVRGNFSDGIVTGSGQANIQVSGTEAKASNVRYSDFDARSLLVAMTSGAFVDGETITAPAGKSGVVRKVIKDLANQEEILFLSSVTGTFSAGDVITGGTSAATATISAVNTPVQRLEQTGGIFTDDARLFSGIQSQERFADGFAIMYATFACDVTIANTLQNFTTLFSSNVRWVAAPIATATVGSVSSSGGYTMSQLRALATTSQITINIDASLAQTYVIQVIAVGRWK